MPAYVYTHMHIHINSNQHKHTHVCMLGSVVCVSVCVVCVYVCACIQTHTHTHSMCFCVCVYVWVCVFEWVRVHACTCARVWAFQTWKCVYVCVLFASAQLWFFTAMYVSLLLRNNADNMVNNLLRNVAWILSSQRLYSNRQRWNYLTGAPLTPTLYNVLCGGIFLNWTVPNMKKLKRVRIRWNNWKEQKFFGTIIQVKKFFFSTI